MPAPDRVSFTGDFKRFFLRGLSALLPTLITLSLIWYVLNFLWESIGQYLIWVIKRAWYVAVQQGWTEQIPAAYIGRYWSEDQLSTKIVGVLLAVLAIYVLGLLIGNLIGRFFWRLGESLVMRLPIVRAIYPAVKQVTDFLLADKSDEAGKFAGSKVVAIKPHASDIWSVALVTGPAPRSLSAATGEEMVTVFMPSSPTAFSGYVIVVPKSGVVELPLTVEEAMRMLVSGGVIIPGTNGTPTAAERKVAAKLAEAAPRPATPVLAE